MKYELKKPITLGKTTLTEVTIKEDYTVSDMELLLNAKEKGSGTAFAVMVSVGTELPMPQAAQIRAVDANAIVSFVNGFLEGGEKT